MAGRRYRNERGANMIEAAIVTPLLFMLIFGILEFSLYFKDKLSASNATRTGARVGSAQGSAALADWDIIQNVVKGQKAWGKITKIVVFKASGPDAAVPASCTTASVGISGTCNVYTSTDFTLSSTSFLAAGYTKDDYWGASTRKTSLSTGSGPDYLGVWVSGTHASVAKTILSDRTITDQAVMRLEPTS